jgi:hypothetical protein
MQINHWVNLSCYKLACDYFLHLQSTLCTHSCPISFILLLCSAAQKMKNSLMKTSYRHVSPQSSASGVVFYSAV